MCHQVSNFTIFNYSPPSITSLSPGVVPTVGAPQAEILGDSFGSCIVGLTAPCHLEVTVTFPLYSLWVDVTDRVRAYRG